MKFKINQIVPVINRKHVKVDALRVVKELVEKSLDSDTKTTYVFERLDGTKIDSDVLEADYDTFDSINDLRKSMLKNATTSIDKLINTLNEKLDAKWPRKAQPEQPTEESNEAPTS